MLALAGLLGAGAGLITRAMPHGDILGFAPPLVISRAEVDAVVARSKRAVDRVADQLLHEGCWTPGA